MSDAFKQWAEEHRDLVGDDYADAVREMAAKAAAYDDGEEMIFCEDCMEPWDLCMQSVRRHPDCKPIKVRIVREVDDE